jgi:anti-sigma B factor antagonist
MTELTASTAPSLVRFTGDLDTVSTPDIREAFAQLQPGKLVIVDLEAVTFLDSAGLGALIGGVRQIRAMGGDAVLCHPSRPVARVLQMTGVDRLVTVAPSVTDALAALGLGPTSEEL